MPLLKTVTLGCKVNQYETEYVRQGLLGAGYSPAGRGEAADLIVINTCTVTLEGDYKSRKIIRPLARENPRAEIIVMGCYATRAPAEVAALPGVVEVLTDKRALPDLLARRGTVDIPSGISSFDRLHRAYVKVQDGCRMQCSYCIVPQVRPELIQPAGRRGRGRDTPSGRSWPPRDRPHRHPPRPLRPRGGPAPAHGARIDLAALVRQCLSVPGHWRLRL